MARDLHDCRTQGLSPEWRLNIAYNAALQAATAALAASGFRVSRDMHHYRVIQSLMLTIGAETGLVRNLDAFRKKRNISGYDRAGMVSDREADEMFNLAEDVRAKVMDWMLVHHPELVEE